MSLNTISLLNKLSIYSDFWIKFITTTTKIVLVAFIGWLAYVVAKRWLAKLVIKIVGDTTAKWDDLMFDQRFFNRLGLLIAPIAISILLSSLEWSVSPIAIKLVKVWIAVASVMLVSVILDGMVKIYNSYSRSKDRPINVFKQVILIFLWCATLLIIISIFTEQPVGGLLAGLAAGTAVTMLIFQDSILGFVAGIQLSANNMVRVGDWIYMPGRNLDGTVTEINLTTVKVQNFDKTITTVPTHKLVSESFTNWQGMHDSGGRRIKRSVNVDVNTIRYLDQADLDRLKKSDFLRSYITEKEKEINDFNATVKESVDERRLTNVGTFREYIETWLKTNDKLNHNMICMVRQLQPGATGMPVEIYCFTESTEWLLYEAVQADIFEHVYAILELFDLKAFQYSGAVSVTE